jgi:hypothetical protein
MQSMNHSTFLFLVLWLPLRHHGSLAWSFSSHSTTNSKYCESPPRRTSGTTQCHSMVGYSSWNRRRSIVVATTFLASVLFLPSQQQNKARAVGVGDDDDERRPRSIDVGGGTDISLVLSDTTKLIFPASLEGRYSCQRTIASIDGDRNQAESVWKALGGRDAKVFFGLEAPPEHYETHLVRSDGSSSYTVIDRGYEWVSRTGNNNNNKSISNNTVQWSTDHPNVLLIGKSTPQQPPPTSSSSRMEIAVIQRVDVITPNLDQGLVAGGKELLRITEGPFVKAVAINQRYRLAADGSGDLEGLEIVKTFRVLDGIAGTEFPTSTTKSRLRLTRLGPLVVQ